MEGKAIIFSAPSGAGKTTIVRHILDQIDSLSFSISATTRERREKEIHAKDYYFLSVEDFENKVSRNELLEWEEVYDGVFYGTLKQEAQRIWNEGKQIIFDIDVKGGINLKKKLGANALSIFVDVKDVNILKERLLNRNTESEETLKKRFDKALIEMEDKVYFDEIIINDNLEAAIEEAKQLIIKFIKG